MKKISKLIKQKASRAFQRWTVLRDCDAYQKNGMFAPCISCGLVKHYDNLQGGHFKAGRGNAILFEENNCHAQCRQCNGHLRGTLKPEEVDWAYREAMLKKIGVKEVMRLESLKWTIKKMKPQDFQDIFDLYVDRLKKLGGPTFVLPKF